MKTSSAKSKGRRLSAHIREQLLAWAPDLSERDIIVTPSGCTGEDLQLSEAAFKIYPYSIEAKNQESIQIWAAFEQAKSHVKGDSIPLLVYSRNRSDVMVSLTLQDFLKLTR